MSAHTHTHTHTHILHTLHPTHSTPHPTHSPHTLTDTLMSVGIFVATVSDLAHPGLTVVYEPKLSNFEYGIYLLQVHAV